MAFLIKNRRICKNILLIMVCVSLILGIASIIYPHSYYIGDKYQTIEWSSLFYNSNHYGYYITICVMITSTILCIARKKWLFICSLFSTILLMFTLFFCNTFGCMLAVFISLILMLIALCLFKHKFDIKYLIPIGLFIIISIISSLLAKQVHSYYNSFFEQSYNLIKELFLIAEAPTSEVAGAAGTDRWSLWLKAFSEIMQSPLIGNGDITLRPHNEYLQFAVVWGLPSLILYLSAIAIIYIKAIKYGKDLSGLTLVCLFSAGGYLISATFGNTMPHTSPFFMVILGFLIRFINEDIQIFKKAKLDPNSSPNNNLK